MSAIATAERMVTSTTSSPARALSSGEQQAFLVSDLAFRLLATRAPAVVLSLALSYRGTRLHRAAYHGDGHAVSELLSLGANPSSKVHSHEMSPLHLAALGGHACAAGDRTQEAP